MNGTCLTKEVTENIDKSELGLGLQKVYDFILEEFCDWYIGRIGVMMFLSEVFSCQIMLFVSTHPELRVKTNITPWWKRIASNWKMCGNRGISQSTDIGARI